MYKKEIINGKEIEVYIVERGFVVENYEFLKSKGVQLAKADFATKYAGNVSTRTHHLSEKIMWEMKDHRPQLFESYRFECWKFTEEEMKKREIFIARKDEHIFVPSRAYSVPAGTANAYKVVVGSYNLLEIVKDLTIIRIGGVVYRLSLQENICEDTEYVLTKGAEIMSLADYNAREERCAAAEAARAERKAQSAGDGTGLFPAWEADGFED